MFDLTQPGVRAKAEAVKKLTMLATFAAADRQSHRRSRISPNIKVGTAARAITVMAIS